MQKVASSIAIPLILLLDATGYGAKRRATVAKRLLGSGWW
jgi:hypothetical protein